MLSNHSLVLSLMAVGIPIFYFFRLFFDLMARWKRTTQKKLESTPDSPIEVTDEPQQEMGEQSKQLPLSLSDVIENIDEILAQLNVWCS